MVWSSLTPGTFLVHACLNTWTDVVMQEYCMLRENNPFWDMNILTNCGPCTRFVRFIRAVFPFWRNLNALRLTRFSHRFKQGFVTWLLLQKPIFSQVLLQNAYTRWLRKLDWPPGQGIFLGRFNHFWRNLSSSEGHMLFTKNFRVTWSCERLSCRQHMAKKNFLTTSIPSTDLLHLNAERLKCNAKWTLLFSCD